jgi:hypothetical protein
LIHSRRIGSFVVTSCFLLGIGSCGGGNEPTNPSTPSPTVPAPTPTPTATPPAPSTSSSCATPAPPAGAGHCGTRPDPLLISQMEQTLDQVRGQADIFYPNGVTIRYIDKYRKAVIEGLDARGLCGVFDYGDNGSGLGDVLYVRTTDNRLSEAYDVVSGSGQARAGYENSCEPASTQPPGVPHYPVLDPKCSLPPSGATFCIGASFETEYGDDVRAAIKAVMVEQPQLFDFKDALESELSFRLIDPATYIAAVEAKLQAKGYCAYEDEELAVKKDDSMNENFDIVRSPAGDAQYSLYVYKGKCHNSLF